MAKRVTEEEMRRRFEELLTELLEDRADLLDMKRVLKNRDAPVLWKRALLELDSLDNHHP